MLQVKTKFKTMGWLVGCCAWLLLLAGSAEAQRNVTYTIRTQTDNSGDAGTDFQVWVTLKSKDGKTSQELRLKGSHGKGKGTDETYTIPDIGPISEIDVELHRPKGLLHSDSWRVQWIEVVYPDGVEGVTSKFSLGRNISANSRTGFVKRDTSLLDEILDSKQVIKPTENRQVVEVLFEPNPTNGDIMANKISQTWSKETAVTVTNGTSKEFNVSATVGYSYDTGVAGQFSAEVTAGFSQAFTKERSETESKGFSESIDWSFEVPAHSSIFREFFLRVPEEYVKYSAPSGEAIIVRRPGGKPTSVTGDRLQIPKLDRDGNIVPVKQSRINQMVRFMSEDTRMIYERTRQNQQWVARGWVVEDVAPNNGIPIANATPPTGRPTAGPTTPSTPTVPTTPNTAPGVTTIASLPSAAIPDETREVMERFQREGHQVKWVAFAPNGGWSVLYGKNGYFNRNIPDELHQLMVKYAQEGRELKSVAFAPNGGWSLLSNKNGYFNRNIPDEVHQLMVKYAQEGRELKSVAYAPNGGWSLLYDKNGYFNRNAPDELHQLVVKYAQEGRELKSVAYAPNGGWSLFYDRHGYFNRNVPDPAHQATVSLSQDGRQLRTMAFTPGGGWLVVSDK